MRRTAIGMLSIWSLVACLLAQQTAQIEPVPPLIVLVERERQAEVQDAFALLENTQQPLESRIRALQEWSHKHQFYYSVQGAYHLLISQPLFASENPNQARYELLRMLVETISSKQPVPVSMLPEPVRAALVTSVQRGKLAQLSGLEWLVSENSHLMMGARIAAEWTSPDGTQQFAWVGESFPSVDALMPNLKPVKTSAPLSKPASSPFTQCLLYNTPAARTVFTHGIRALSVFWESLDLQARESYENLSKMVVERLTREMEKEFRQGIASDWVRWASLPLDYQQRLLQSVQRRGLEPPSVLRLTVRPAMCVFVVDSRKGVIHRVSWSLDEEVYPIRMGYFPLK